MIQKNIFEELKRSGRKKTNDAAANRMMGKAMLEKGKYKEALRFYQISNSISKKISNQIVVDFEEYLINDITNVQARMALVDFHLLRGDLEAAIIELEELTEIAPEVAQVYVMLGRIYLKMGRLDGAIKLLEKARESGLRDITLLEPLANAYIEKERYADAILLYEQCLKEDPGSKRVLRILSELYKRLSNFDSAAKACVQMLSDSPDVISETVSKLEELSKMSPGSSYVKEQLAQSYIKSLKPDQAVDELKKVIELDTEKLDNVISSLKYLLQIYPNNQNAMLTLAKCLTRKKLFSEAVETYIDIQKADPEVTKKCIEGYMEIIKLYPDQALAHQALADSFFMIGKSKEALNEYSMVVRLNPNEAATIEKRCKEILKRDPEMFEACVVLAQAFWAGGENRKAITLAEELVQRDNKCLNAYRVLGDAYFNLDMLGRSKEAFYEALKLSPYDANIQVKYQMICEKEIEKEISQVVAKIQQDQWRAGLNYDLARLLHKKGSLSEALRALQSAVKDNAKAAASHNLMGIIFKEQGRFDLAKIQFEKALEYKNEGSEDLEKALRANLASCLEAMGRVSEAINMYVQVATLDVEFGDISKRARQLRACNSYSKRYKTAAMVFENTNTKKIMPVWGRDARRSRTLEEGLSFVSFGEEQNNKGFDDLIKEAVQSSRESFALATQLDATLISAFNNLACCMMLFGDLEEATHNLAHANTEDRGSAVYLNNLGALSVLKKDDEAAEKYFHASIKADKDLSAAVINLADIKMRRKETKEAMELYNRIDAYDPLREIVARRLMYWVF